MVSESSVAVAARPSGSQGIKEEEQGEVLHQTAVAVAEKSKDEP